MMKILVVALLLCLGLICSIDIFAHGMSEEDKALILNGGYAEYLKLGAIHMVTGYDHVLFLIGVVFFLTRFKQILVLVTAFTLGHSLTLVFATVFTIQADYFLIDAVIALTVCYKAFDNLEGFKRYLNIESPNIAVMVFIFGLIHGFGLSTRLQMLPLGDDGLVLRILAFNLGVEIGQVCVLLIVVALLAGWRRKASFQQFSAATNTFLLIVGALLFLMQMHGYQHAQYADDFPLNKDDHHHLHQKQDKVPRMFEWQDPIVK